MSGLNCIVVTPEATALDEKVDSVVVPLFDGELGIGSSHAPMIGRLGFGELRLTTGGQTTKYFVEDGFVQVQDNVVSVLTSRVRSLDSINEEEAQKLLEEALGEKSHTAETIALRDKKAMQARAMIRAATK